MSEPVSGNPKLRQWLSSTFNGDQDALLKCARERQCCRLTKFERHGFCDWCGKDKEIHSALCNEWMAYFQVKSGYTPCTCLDEQRSAMRAMFG